MDSVLKLVYDNWTDAGYPLPNGVHPKVINRLKQLITTNPTVSLGQHQETIRQEAEGNPFLFDHSNVFTYFKQDHPLTDIVRVSQVDDNHIYVLPIEIRTSTDQTCRPNTIKVDGETFTYSIIDTFSTELLTLLQQGKVKILFNLAHDPLELVSQLWDIECYFRKYNINGGNLIFTPGNDCQQEYSDQFPKGKMRVIPCRFMITQQACRDYMSFPRETSFGYISDVVREPDLDKNHIRSKRFVCFNRTMRDHRYMIANLALKHNLLINGVFSFLNSFDHGQEHVSRILKDFGASDYKNQAKKVLDLFPYELDTHHLGKNEKGGFSSENTKKEWYSDTYVHLISETRFVTGTTPFISEKTWRPVMNLQPFIMIGNHGSLKVLHEMGFKTFSPFIDESYDDEKDYKKRMKKIEQEIVKLNNMPIQELHDWYYSITDILLHNQSLLSGLAVLKPFEQTFNDINSYYRKK